MSTDITTGVIAEIDGFKDFSNILKKYAEIDENGAVEALQTGVNLLVKDLLALPKPKSDIRRGKHTHLVDTFASERKGQSINVGWGKYYGRMVEKGHRTVNGKTVKPQPHMIPMWEKNKEKYYKAAVNQLQF